MKLALRLIFTITTLVLSGCVTTPSPTDSVLDDQFVVLPEKPRDQQNPKTYLKDFRPTELPVATDGQGSASACRKAQEVQEVISHPNSLTTLFLAIEKKTGKFSCTGTFIAVNVVLTAAHCVYPAADNILSIRVYPGLFTDKAGNNIKNGKGSENVFSVRINPKFSMANPKTLTAEESEKDFAFLILRDDSLWKSVGSPTIPKLVRTTTQVGAGTQYEYIGYPAIGANTLPIRLYKFDPIFLDSFKTPLLPEIRFDGIPGCSGGALREAGNDTVAGITSSLVSPCQLRFAWPFDEIIKTFRDTSEVAQCVNISDSTCEKGCCRKGYRGIHRPYIQIALTSARLYSRNKILSGEF